MGNPDIVDAARSPDGRRRGWLSGPHPAGLLGAVRSGILDRLGMDPHGGAIALGHPVGSSGVRLGGTAVCAGGAMVSGVIIERV